MVHDLSELVESPFDHVAAAVGRLSVRVFGDASAAADQVAFSLGRALQLTSSGRGAAESG